MAYTILNTDGTTLILLADGQIDKSATSLTLIGKNYASYGQELNNNFVRLMTNFASSSGSPPRSPLTGQLWYDSTQKRLKIYDNGFRTIGAVNIASSLPNFLQNGDLWFDSSNQQLRLYNAGLIYNIGPAYSSAIGKTGINVPQSIITDQDSLAKDVLLIQTYGTTVGLVYHDSTGAKESFEMDLTDLATYAPNATTSTVVSGITVIGDLNVEGRLSNNYLSLAVDLDVVSPNPNNDALAFASPFGTAAGNQNAEIVKILNQVFPPNSSVVSNTSTAMSGVLLGTQARVLCKFTSIGGTSKLGYQTRVFKTIEGLDGLTWYEYNFNLEKAYFDTERYVNYITTSTSSS